MKVLNLERLFDRNDLAEARARRNETLRAVKEAKGRGDTRALHYAQHEARKATCVLVALELRGKRA